jgi:hypothetical protein
MSYLSLLFTSATQGMANAPRPCRETEGEAHAALDVLEKMRPGPTGGPNDYQLPSGVASLEHWLDLNA